MDNRRVKEKAQVNWIRKTLKKINNPRTIKSGTFFFAVRTDPDEPMITHVARATGHQDDPASQAKGVVYSRPKNPKLGELYAPYEYEFYEAGNYKEIPTMTGGKRKMKKTRKVSRKGRRTTYRRHR